MFINRDWTRTEEDDFKLNVQPRLDSSSEAIPRYAALDPAQYPAGTPDPIIGWDIQPRGE
jgi:hypothetical protein